MLTVCLFGFYMSCFKRQTGRQADKEKKKGGKKTDIPDFLGKTIHSSTDTPYFLFFFPRSTLLS